MPTTKTAERWQTRAAYLVVAATLVRLAVIATTELGDGECYYYSWSRFPALSYYDHPPLLAWIVWLMTRVSHTGFFIRLGPVLCSAALGVMFYRLAARLFGPRAGFLALAILTALPAFILNSFVVNPETPLATCWVFFLSLLESMRRRDERWRPALTGAVIGLAFLAKYTAILMVPITFTYLAMSPVARRWLRRPSFYLGGISALCVAAPVILWNQRNDWPSLTLHFVERAAPFTVASLAANALKVVGGQLVAFSPFLFPCLLAALVVAMRRGRTDDRYRFLAHSSWPVLLFFLVVMLRVRDSEDHWTMVGFIPLAIAAGAWLDEGIDRSPLVRWYLRACFGLSAVGFFLVVLHIHTGALIRLFSKDGYDGNTDMSNELIDWKPVRDAVRDVRASLGENVVVASGQYALCAHILYQIDDNPTVYCPTARRTEFDFIGRRDPPPRATVVFVNNDPHPETPGELLPDYRCDHVRDVAIERAGRTVRHFGIFVCSPPG
jgi:hypothetical protein